jgi:hypothetical protein
MQTTPPSAPVHHVADTPQELLMFLHNSASKPEKLVAMTKNILGGLSRMEAYTALTLLYLHRGGKHSVSGAEINIAGGRVTSTSQLYALIDKGVLLQEQMPDGAEKSSHNQSHWWRINPGKITWLSNVDFLLCDMVMRVQRAAKKAAANGNVLQPKKRRAVQQSKGVAA